MSELRKSINEKLKTALKEKEQVTISTIRLIMAALKDRDIASRGKGEADGISDSEILSMLQGMIKQRVESATTYSDAGRNELAERERAEIKVIETFLPKQLDESELEAIIDKLIEEKEISGMRDMGKLMAELKSSYAGQIDMSKAGAMIKNKLS